MAIVGMTQGAMQSECGVCVTKRGIDPLCRKMPVRRNEFLGCKEWFGTWFDTAGQNFQGGNAEIMGPARLRFSYPKKNLLLWNGKIANPATMITKGVDLVVEALGIPKARVKDVSFLCGRLENAVVGKNEELIEVKTQKLTKGDQGRFIFSLMSDAEDWQNELKDILVRIKSDYSEDLNSVRYDRRELRGNAKLYFEESEHGRTGSHQYFVFSLNWKPLKRLAKVYVDHWRGLIAKSEAEMTPEVMAEFLNRYLGTYLDHLQMIPMVVAPERDAKLANRILALCSSHNVKAVPRGFGAFEGAFVPEKAVVEVTEKVPPLQYGSRRGVTYDDSCPAWFAQGLSAIRAGKQGTTGATKTAEAAKTSPSETMNDAAVVLSKPRLNDRLAMACDASGLGPIMTEWGWH